MTEAVKVVAAKSGISEVAAVAAVEAVADYLRTRLPTAFAVQVEMILKGTQAGPSGGASYGSLFE